MPISTSDTWTSTEEGISVFFFVFATLLALVLVLCKVLHDHPRLASILPEPGMVLLVGIIVGFFVNRFIKVGAMSDDDGDDGDDTNEEVAKGLLSFSPKILFVALLPPIIFNSGYHLRRELFFRHFTPICLLACVGTVVSAVTIALLLKFVSYLHLTGSFDPTFNELLAFGALISATDTVSTLAVFQSKRVDPHLFYLVFGESALNDAVGLVLFNAFAKFVVSEDEGDSVGWGIFDFVIDFTIDFAGSLCLGTLSGMFAALLLKHVDMRQTRHLELSLYILITYVPFLLAEIMRLSGIVAIFFTGMAARRYAVPNLSESTEANADVFFRLAAHLAETSIFLELGLSVFGLSGDGNFQWRFLLWALLACLIGRAANVYPIVFLFNLSLPQTETTSYNNENWEGHVEMIDKPKDFPDNQDSGGDIVFKSADGGIRFRSASSATTSLVPAALDNQRIPPKTMHLLWFAGLRGAVAYACVKSFPDTFGHRTEFVVTTMAIVLITVFFMGGTTELVMTALKIDVDVDEDKYMEKSSQQDGLTGFVHRIENKYICRFVIRDFGMVEQSDDEHSSAYHQNSFQFQEHVEMTESGHFNTLERMAYPTHDGPRHQESLYDHGAVTF